MLRYDLRGYGRSARLDGAPYSHVRDLVALLDRLEIERTALVGCSMGGAIALDATLDRSRPRVRRWCWLRSGLGGFEENDAEERGGRSGSGRSRPRWRPATSNVAQDLRLGVWAPLGTDDDAGPPHPRDRVDNIHELTMDESGELGDRPARCPAARRGRRCRRS